MPRKQTLKVLAAVTERKAIRAAIKRHGSRKAAALALDITTETIRRKLK